MSNTLPSSAEWGFSALEADCSHVISFLGAAATPPVRWASNSIHSVLGVWIQRHPHVVLQDGKGRGGENQEERRCWFPMGK